MLYSSVTGPKGPDSRLARTSEHRAALTLPPPASGGNGHFTTKHSFWAGFITPKSSRTRPFHEAGLWKRTRRQWDQTPRGSEPRGLSPQSRVQNRTEPRRSAALTPLLVRNVGAEQHRLASFILQNASNKTLNIKMDNARIMGYSVGEVQKFSCGSSRIINSFIVWFKGCTDHTRQRALTSSPRAGWSLAEAERPRRGSLPRPSPCRLKLPRTHLSWEQHPRMCRKAKRGARATCQTLTQPRLQLFFISRDMVPIRRCHRSYLKFQ